MTVSPSDQLDRLFQAIDAKNGSSLACEGEVCYRRHDDTEVVLPFVDTFEFDDSLISSYRINIDIAPLYAE